MKFFTLFLATLLYAGNALMLRTVNNHAAVLDAREQVQQTQTAMYDWKDGIIYKKGEEDKKKPLDLAVFAKDGLIKKAHKENTDRKDKTFVVDMEVEGIKFSLADIHMDGNGPDGSPKKAAKTIKQFLMDEGLNKDRLKGLDAVAGDSNITPHKVSKTIPGLKPNADLTRQIAKALSDISSDGSDPWCVYMANTQVGKRRVGFSLMNNQIFKSEPQAGGISYRPNACWKLSRTIIYCCQIIVCSRRSGTRRHFTGSQKQQPPCYIRGRQVSERVLEKRRWRPREAGKRGRRGNEHCL